MDSTDSRKGTEAEGSFKTLVYPVWSGNANFDKSTSECWSCCAYCTGTKGQEAREDFYLLKQKVKFSLCLIQHQATKTYKGEAGKGKR
jgi:hypothetical protein